MAHLKSRQKNVLVRLSFEPIPTAPAGALAALLSLIAGGVGGEGAIQIYIGCGTLEVTILLGSWLLKFKASQLQNDKAQSRLAIYVWAL
jgi:hypothetical protein